MILEGRIRLNGKKVTELGTMVDTSSDTIHVNGQAVNIGSEESKKKYIFCSTNHPVW